MPLPSSVHALQMASIVSKHMIDKGYWEACTPQYILRLADSYAELARWHHFSLAYYRMDGYFYDLNDVPDNFSEGNVRIVKDGRTLRYILDEGKWRYLQDETPFD